MITVNAAELGAAIKRVRHASPSSADRYARPILATIAFHGINPTTLRLVAVDNYRIAMNEIKSTVGLDADGKPADGNDATDIGIAPVDIADIKVLLPFLALAKDNVDVELVPGAIRVATKYRSVLLRVQDGAYPKYEDVVAQYTAGATTVALQPKFLADTAKALGAAGVAGMKIRAGGRFDPVFIDTIEHDGYQEIILPIRTRDDED